MFKKQHWKQRNGLVVDLGQPLSIVLLREKGLHEEASWLQSWSWVTVVTARSPESTFCKAPIEITSGT